jgi:hypothetical protein
MGELDLHAGRIVVWDLESHTDLMYGRDRPTPPLLRNINLL